MYDVSLGHILWVFRPGKSRNDFHTLGIGIGKLPSLFPTFWIMNEKSNSQFLGLEMGMKHQIPNIWDWEWEIASDFQKSRECNCEFENASSVLSTMLSKGGQRRTI